jgi:hypothetical protein
MLPTRMEYVRGDGYCSADGYLLYDGMRVAIVA